MDHRDKKNFKADMMRQIAEHLTQEFGGKFDQGGATLTCEVRPHEQKDGTFKDITVFIRGDGTVTAFTVSIKEVL